MPTCGCGDLALEVWLLAWPAHALTHGLNPFFTNAMNVPRGVNLGSNTGMTLLGILATPVTLTIGAVAAFNLFMQLAFFLSATSMFFVLRRWTTWLPAAFVGGLLYGFSPYMIGQGNGHLFLLFVPIPPLILAVLDNLLVRERWSPLRAGLLLGLLAGAQYLISSEVLADTVLIAALGIVVLAVWHRKIVRAKIVPLVTGVLWALLPFALLAGYPIWFTLFGPQHVTGPWAPASVTGVYRADLLGPIVPTVSQLFGGAHWLSIGSAFSGENVTENGIYLGIPLVVICIGLAVLAWRRAVVRFAVVMALISFVLACGSPLTVDNHSTGIPLPFTLLRKLPLLRQEIAGRYSLYVVLFVAVLFAVGIDELRSRLLSGQPKTERVTARHARRKSRSPVVVTGGITVLIVVALIPLFPRLPYPTPRTGIPAYFTSDASTGVQRIPVDSVVLTYPYPINPNNYAMLWQAAAGMRFRIIGDYAVTPAGHGNGTLAPPTLQPSAMESLFEIGESGLLAATGPPLPSTLAELRQFCLRYHVGTIIVDPTGKDPQIVVRYLTEALGAPPVASGGVDVWYDVRSRSLAMTGAPLTP